jgi:serine/threonine protein kinase
MVGASVNQYRVSANLGQGGMGEVYRAHDTRLNREVAVKVLPKAFASDADRLRRFEQETKTLAALNHPNIVTLYDAGVHEGAPYLVSELLEGQTLREVLQSAAGAPLPVRKAIDYALQIAHGLAAAHNKGIIHRDLKPENIFVTRDGRVKILDFGLSKLQAPNGKSQIAGRKSLDEAAPTALDATEPGVVLGTPAYMSPEQVRGDTADHRSDIFAFGCVLYEMLSGARAFRRDTSVESMNAILKEEPPELVGLNSAVPPAAEQIVRRCLDKQADSRFQSAKDLAFALEVSTSGSQKREALATAPRPWPMTAKAWWAAVGIAIVATLIGFDLGRTRSTPAVGTAPSVRYVTYSGRDFSPSASPDGKRICFRSDRDGTNKIWLKEITSGLEAPLTSGPDDFPRFSPDGNRILFIRASGSKRSLFHISSNIGGEPFKIVDDALAADWSPDGRQITFARWPEAGGTSIYTTGVDGSGEALLLHMTNRGVWPRWSPDGKTIALSVNVSGHPQFIALLNMATRQAKLVPAPQPYNVISSVAWARNRQALYCMQAESVAANSGGSPAFLYACSLTADSFQKLLWSPVHSRVLDWLPNGNLLLDSRSSRENLKELPIGTNTASPRFLTLGNSTDRQPAYSPNGEEVVFSSNRSGNLEVWALSRKTRLVRRLTDHPADDWDPGVSPDGQHLIWGAKRSGNLEIWIAHADGTSPRQLTHDGFSAENPTMTRDGSWVVYASTHPQKAGLWKIHPDGTGATRLSPLPNAALAELSPDSRYIAFIEDKNSSLVFVKVIELETGAPVPFQIRIEAVKETAALLGRVRWMPDGKALAFLGQDEHGIDGVFAQDFVPGLDTSKTRRPLGGFDPDNSVESFGISPDGQFLTVAAWEQFFSIMETQDLSFP